MSTRRVVALSAFALMFAVGTAGCTKDKTPAVATANPDATKASAAPTGNGSALKYSQCMRDQGLTWFPDPGADGGLKVSVPEGTDQAKIDKAEATCKASLPGGGKAVPMSAADLDKIRKASQCMRDKGFTKYPDPDANGGITIDSKVLGVEPEDPAFQKARQECQKYLPPPKKKAS